MGERRDCPTRFHPPLHSPQPYTPLHARCRPLTHPPTHPPLLSCNNCWAAGRKAHDGGNTSDAWLRSAARPTPLQVAVTLRIAPTLPHAPPWHPLPRARRLQHTLAAAPRRLRATLALHTRISAWYTRPAPCSRGGGVDGAGCLAVERGVSTVAQRSEC